MYSVCTVVCRYSAAIFEVVPPQTMCLPSFAKNSAIMRWLSLIFSGGPMAILTVWRWRILTMHVVASSKGFPPYSLLVSSIRRFASTFDVSPDSLSGSMNFAIASLSQDELSTPLSLAYSMPSLSAMNISPSASSKLERYIVFSPIFIVESGNSYCSPLRIRITFGFSYWIMSAWALSSSLIIVKVEKAVFRSEHIGSVSAMVSTASRISSPAASMVDIIVDVSVESILALTPLPSPSARTTMVEFSFSTIST